MRRKTTKRAGLRGTPNEHAAAASGLIDIASYSADKALEAKTCTQAIRRLNITHRQMGAAEAEINWTKGDVEGRLERRLLTQVVGRVNRAEKHAQELCACSTASLSGRKRTTKRKKAKR